MGIEREGSRFYIFPILDGKPLNLQWGFSRSNCAETKALVHNSVQELQDGVDEINSDRALKGLAFGDLDFRNKFRLWYNSDTTEITCQKNDGSVDTPIWTDVWQVRDHDGQFQVVSTGGVYSLAGFYSGGRDLQTIEAVAESGVTADVTISDPSKLFFNADSGFGVQPIASGANAGQPEVIFTQPYGRAQKFSKAGKEWAVEHEFGTTPVLVQVMDSDDRVVIPDRADVSNPNIAYFYFNSPFTGSVYIASGGVGGTGVGTDPRFNDVTAEGFYVQSGGELSPAGVMVSDGTQQAPSVSFVSDRDMGLFRIGSNDLGVVVNAGVKASFDANAINLYEPVITSVSGTAAEPAVRFSTDPNTGVYRVGDDILGVAAGGTESARFGNTLSKFTTHVRMEDTLDVENAVTAEAFYLQSGGEANSLRVREQDGAPNIANVKDIVVTDGALTDNGDGTVTLSIGGAGGIDVKDENNVYLSPSNLTFANAYFYLTSDSGGDPVANLQPSSVGGLFPDGAVGAPSIAFTNDTDSGLYRVGEDNIGITVGGAIRQQVTAGGAIVYGTVKASQTATATAPAYSFVSNTNLGMYMEDTDTLGFSTDGVHRARIGKDGMRVEDKIVAEAFYVAGRGEISSNGTNLSLDGGGNTIFVEDRILVQPGTVDIPGIGFDGDYDTGLYHVSAETLGFATGGTHRASIGKDGMSVDDKVVAEAFYVTNGGNIYNDGTNLHINGGGESLIVGDKILAQGGTSTAPGISFEGYPGSGLYRSGGTVYATVGGAYSFAFGSTVVVAYHPLQLPLGSAAVPSLAPQQDPDTGIYSKAANTLGFSAGGTHRASIGRDGLSVEDKIVAEAFYLAGRGDISSNGTTMSIDGGGNTIFIEDRILVQNGTEGIPGIGFDGDYDTGLYHVSANTLGFSAGGTHRASIGRDGLSVEDKIVAEAFYLKSGGEIGGSSLTVREADSDPSVSNVSTLVVTNGSLTDDGAGQVTLAVGGGGSINIKDENNVYTAPSNVTFANAYFYLTSDSGGDPVVNLQPGVGGESYTEEFNASVEWVVNHNLDSVAFVAQCYKGTGEMVIPDTVHVNDQNTAYFYFAIPQDGRAVILTSGGTGGGSGGVSDHGDLTGLSDDDHALYALADGTRDFTGHVRMEDTLDVENAVTAEAFYLKTGGEVGGAALTVREADNSPTVSNVDTIVVTNGSLTDDGGGQVTLDVGSGSGDDARFNTVTSEGFYVQSGGELGPVGVLVPDGLQGAPSVSFTNDTDTGLFRSATNNLSVVAGGGVKAVFETDAVRLYEALLLAGSGSAAEPTLRFAVDEDTGVFRVSENTIGVSTGGVERHRISQNGAWFKDKITAEAFYLQTGGELGTLSLTVKEADSDPTVSNVDTIVVTNGSLTDDGAGQVTLDVGGGSGDAARFNTVTAEGFYVQSGGELGPAGLFVPVGAEGTPSVSFTGDPDTGIYQPAANQVAITTGGSVASLFTGAFNIHYYPQVLPDGTEVNPSFTFLNDLNTGIYSAGSDNLGFSAGGSLQMTVGRDGVRVEDKVEAEAFYLTGGGEIYRIGLNTRIGGGGNTIILDDRILVQSGTAAIPGMGFSTDFDTGLYRPETNTLGVVTGGVERHRISQNGAWFKDKITAEAFYLQSGGEVGSAALTVREVDSDPSVSSVDTIVVTNGTLTDDGGGQVTLAVGGGGGADIKDENNVYTAPSNLTFANDYFYLTSDSGGDPVVNLQPKIPTSYVENFSAAVEWEVSHNLNRRDFIAQCYKGTGEMVIPDTIHVNDSNTAYFYFAVAQDGKAVILGLD